MDGLCGKRVCKNYPKIPSIPPEIPQLGIIESQILLN
jgi:hypothetical protein